MASWLLHAWGTGSATGKEQRKVGKHMGQWETPSHRPPSLAVSGSVLMEGAKLCDT